MLAVFIDGFGSFIGGLIGFKFNKYLSEKHLNSILLILNLTVAIIGIQGAIKMDNMALLLVSVCIGSIIGVSFDIDGKFNSLGDFFEEKIEKKFGSVDSDFSKGFITAAIVQSVGALSIIGPMEIVFKGDYSLMTLKAILDFVTSIVLGSTYGAGVMLASVVLIVYQGGIILLSGVLKPLLTGVVINQISAVGSLLIFALSLDLLELKRIKVANYLPSILIPIIFHGLKLIFI